MNKILSNFSQKTMVVLCLLVTFPALGSLSVLTEGNPRLYSLEKGEVEATAKESKTKVLLKEFFLKFEGADLKEGLIKLEGQPKISSIKIKRANIKSDDGTFSCSALLMAKEKGVPHKGVTFDLQLEPIKNGFEVKTTIKEIPLKLKATLKKQ